MHRSEGDFGNSIYWFGKIGNHPVYEALRREVEKLERSSNSREALRALLKETEWDSRHFVGLCQKAREGEFGDLKLLQQVAAAEYHLLMSFVLKQSALP